MGRSGSVGMVFVHGTAAPVMLVAVKMVALVPFAGVEFVAMHSFHVFSQRTGVSVSFGTSRSFASIGFLK